MNNDSKPCSLNNVAVMESLVWHSLRLKLRSTRSIGTHTPVLKILQSTLKHIPIGNDSNLERPAIKRAFHVPEAYGHLLKYRSQTTFPLEVLFFGADTKGVADWLQTFSVYLATSSRANFELVDVNAIVRHSGLDIMHPISPGNTHAELEILTPLPFKRLPQARQTELTLNVFLEGLQRRIKSLYGEQLPLPDIGEIRMQTGNWRYIELLTRPSTRNQTKKLSSTGTIVDTTTTKHTQYYNGCVGSLYFVGDLAPLMPWLRLAEAIHAGGDVVLNPLGHCCLHVPARPRFDIQIVRADTWMAALEKVQHEHDDWAASLVSEQGAPFIPSEYCTELAKIIATNEWKPVLATAFILPKRDGVRRLEKLPLRELILHTGLYNLIVDSIDTTLSPAVMGYRRRCSVQMAVSRVRELIEVGYRYAITCDIEDFFPSIDLNRLESLLNEVLPPSDLQLRKLLKQLLHNGYIDEDGLQHPRAQGLAQGSPLSPLLANLYLNHFDEILSNADAKLIRYADDFVIFTRSQKQAETMLHRAQSELNAAGLRLGAAKTAIHNIEDGFHFLGQPFGGAAADTLVNGAAAPLRKTVYITEPYRYLGHNGDALEIRHAGQPLDTIPLRRVSDIVLLSPANISSGLAQKCSKLNIPLVFAQHGQNPVAILAPGSRKHHETARAQALHYSGLTPTARLALAKAFASQKITNYKPLIIARYRAGHAQLLAALDDAIAGIEEASDTVTVRGYEGSAARRIHVALNEFITLPEFRFQQRLRKQPDRMNSLFNFGYHLLFCRLNALVRSAGLNPYLGFLHDGAEDYETLVCDIEELFRAPIDRFLVSLVNLHIIKADDFCETPKGMRLRQDALKRFLQRYEEMLHSDVGNVSLLGAMEAQVEAFRRYIADEQPLWFFHYQTANGKTHNAPTSLKPSGGFSSSTQDK